MTAATMTEDRVSHEAEVHSSSRSPLHPAWLGGLSGLLLWFAFPPAEWHVLAWVALVPLLLLVGSERSRRAVYLGAWLGGLVFWTLSTEWIRLTDESAWLAWLLMALVLSAFWPIFLGLARFATKRLGLPLMIVAPIAWLTLEYARAYFLTGFPWYYLAHTQFRQVELIQISDFAGAWGLSFLIVVVNAAVADALSLPLLRPTPKGPRLTRGQSIRLGTAAGLLLLTFLYGIFRVRTADFKPGPTVALLQSDLIQQLGSRRDPKEVTAYYESLVDRALGGEKKPDLIVWPETMYPYGYVAIDPALPPAEFAEQIEKIDPGGKPDEWTFKRENVDGHLHSLIDNRTDAAMLVGTILYDFRAGGPYRYNAAVLIEPRKPGFQSYKKLHLVPFGEYVPLLEAFPWLTYLTPFRGSQTPSLNHGVDMSWIEHGPYRYAVAICFEDTLPQVVRRHFAEVSDGRQPDVLLNQSNDGWFHASSEHEMHLACSVFRSVEHRVPHARSANTGISAVIDGNGRIINSLPTANAEGQMVDGVIIETIPLDPRTGLYTRVGDWLPIGCLAITIGWFPLARFRRKGPKVVRGRDPF